MPEPKKTKSKKEHPFKRLQTDLAVVIAGIEPGGKLPSEPELALKLGVSRATLREAMRAFEEQGLIRRRQGVGTFVVRHQQVIDAVLVVAVVVGIQTIQTLAAERLVQPVVLPLPSVTVEHGGDFQGNILRQLRSGAHLPCQHERIARWKPTVRVAVLVHELTESGE